MSYFNVASRPLYDAGMAGSRKWRIVKLLALAVIGCVLLFVFYIGSYGCLCFNAGRREFERGAIDVPAAVDLNGPLYAPLAWYKESDGPGALQLRAFYSYCLLKGARFPTSWEHCCWYQRLSRPGPPGPEPPIYDEDGREWQPPVKD